MRIEKDFRLVEKIYERICYLNDGIRKLSEYIEDEELKKLLKEILYGEVINKDLVGGTHSGENRLQLFVNTFREIHEIQQLYKEEPDELGDTCSHQTD